MACQAKALQCKKVYSIYEEDLNYKGKYAKERITKVDVAR